MDMTNLRDFKFEEKLFSKEIPVMAPVSSKGQLGIVPVRRIL